MEQILRLLENPTMANILVSTMAEQYKPVIYAVGNEILKVYKDFADNTDFTDTKAKARKNQYDSYVKVGFTHDEAMSLLLTDIRQTAELLKRNSTNKTTVSKSK